MMVETQLLLDLIVKLAPTGGKVIQDFLSKRKDKEISTDELNTLILVQLVENENQIIANQNKIIGTEEKICTVLSNHIEHETQVLGDISQNLKKNLEALFKLVTQIRHLRIDLKLPNQNE